MQNRSRDDPVRSLVWLTVAADVGKVECGGTEDEAHCARRFDRGGLDRCAPAAPRPRSKVGAAHHHHDSPANMSIYEEGTISVVGPMMGVFNNLVVFDPNQKQNSLADIVPDLADSWSWNAEGTELTFTLHPGVKRHDGKPFTAADVKCTGDLLQGKAQDKLRLNAREAWWINLDQVTADSDLQATFHPCRRGSRRSWRCSPRALPRSIRVMCRPRRCGSTRSAPGRSCLPNSSRTNRSRWSRTRITGNRGCPISTASSGRSSPIARPRSSLLLRAIST